MVKTLLAIWCLGLAAFTADAQTLTNVLDRFDPAGQGTNSYAGGLISKVWSNWFGGAFQALAWDGASDANNNPNSGSLKITANFPVKTDQFEVWNGQGAINPPVTAMLYTNFQCDIRFAAGSAASGGNFGSVQFGLPTPTYGQDYFSTSVTVPASNTNWVHVSIPLNPVADTNLLAIGGLLIHIWGAGLTGASTLWVDNLQFVGMATNPGTAVLNYTNTHQRIDGFGASSAWMSGTLSTADADLFFSTNTGAGMSFLRTRIAPDGTTWEGNIAQQAVARGARVWSTPWSPPAVYKDTNSVNGGHFVGSAANYQAYANLLAKYVAGVKSSYGINLFALSLQNEPDYATDYESCLWTSQQFHDFLPYVHAAMVASGVAATKIMLPEDAHWTWELATNSMSDPTTAGLVDILAAHNYGSSPAVVNQFGTPVPKILWETEHYLGTDDSITNGLQLAQEMHAFMTVAQANAYHYWWLKGSGTGSIANDTANPAKRLYVMGQYSRFVRPNFYRFDVTNTSLALVSAYKDTNSFGYVIVAANPTAATVRQTFVLTNFPATGALTQWVTSASQSLANQGVVNVTNRSFNYILPPWTVVSFVLPPPPPPTVTVSVTGGNLSLAWPSNYLGWTLQRQTNGLAVGPGTNWVDVPGTTSTNRLNNLPLPVKGSGYFRLRQ